jgi:hypothetical protein
MTEHNFNILRNNKKLLYKALEDEFSNAESNLRKFIGKDSTKVAAVKGRYEIIKKLIDKVINRKRMSPEVLVGGFYQKNQASSQDRAIAHAQRRINEF